VITGFLVLICIFFGCLAALFVSLFARRSWAFGMLAGIAICLLAAHLIGLSVSWGNDYFWEEQLRLTVLALLPVTFVAWTSARRTRKALEENY
jgi:lipopolysaccharide export LptBFGC system permease protein LptF